MHGKVLTVKDADKEAGAAVVVCEKKAPACDSQAWYTDENGIIHAKLNDFALTGTKGKINIPKR